MGNILEAVQTYIKTYDEIDSEIPVWIVHLGTTLSECAIVPLPGERVLETYLDGSSLRTYPFAFQTVESTRDELARLEIYGFYEEFAEWLESQTNAGELPVLPSGKTAEEIAPTGWAYLIESAESEKGIFQIMCRLIYTQDA